mgnify:CR=1 FL=1
MQSRATHCSFCAYGELAGAHDRIYFLGYDHSQARLKLAETADSIGSPSAPRFWRDTLALAQHLYWAYQDYDRAQEELDTARRTLPNESRIPLLAGYIDRRQGNWEKSLEEMNRALGVGPARFSILQQISAELRKRLRRYKETADDSGSACWPWHRRTFRARVRRASG